MFKKKDLVLTAHLRQDARMPLTRLSRKTGIPVSTIFDRLKANDLVIKHTALLDFGKVGYAARAYILLRTKKEEKENLRLFLLKSFYVNSLYKVNNGFDFLAECVFRDVREVEEFIDTVDGRFSIKTKEIHYIIDDIKREDFLSHPELVDVMFAA